MANVKLSIGILAHNEEKNIEATLRSLLDQSFLQENIASDKISEIEIVVVPNATTDRTVEITEKVLSAAVPSKVSSAVTYKIENLKEGGKTNAWNQYLHRLSIPDADFLVLMDADIQFYEPDVLLKMFLSLQENPDKWVNTGYPLKSLALKKDKSLLEQMSLAISKESKARTPQICGQLYMARAEKLRRITLPLGTNGDDGIIAEMICTNFFTQPYDAHKMMLALDTPSHTFEAYVSPLAFIRHERELVKVILGHQWLYKHLKAIQSQSQQSLGDYIRSCNETIPGWMAEIYRDNTIQAEIKWTWFIPKWLMFRRFQWFNNRSLFQNVFLAPLVFLASSIDFVVFFLANQDLNLRTFERYWRDSK
jgi:glycosyltransferase involved in cell wall biosynthesis